MLEYNTRVIVANYPGCLHIIIFLNGQDTAAHNPCILGNGNKSYCNNRLVNALAERRHKCNRKQDGRDGEHHIHKTHNHGIGFAAAIAGDRT